MMWQADSPGARWWMDDDMAPTSLNEGRGKVLPVLEPEVPGCGGGTGRRAGKQRAKCGMADAKPIVPFREAVGGGHETGFPMRQAMPRALSFWWCREQAVLQAKEG